MAIQHCETKAIRRCSSWTTKRHGQWDGRHHPALLDGPPRASGARLAGLPVIYVTVGFDQAIRRSVTAIRVPESQRAGRLRRRHPGATIIPTSPRSRQR